MVLYKVPILEAYACMSYACDLQAEHTQAEVTFLSSMQADHYDI